MSSPTVLCPCCGEHIGLTEPDELILPIHHGTIFGSFVCHACQSGWKIEAAFEPFDTTDDAGEGE